MENDTKEKKFPAALKGKMMNKKATKWFRLAAVFMFTAATFQIVNDHFILGAVFFCSAVCFASAAGICRKREKDE